MAWLLLALACLAACSAAPADEEVKKELQALKTEVAALRERLAQVEGSQKILLDLVKELQKAREAAPAADKSAQEPTGVAAAPPGQPAPLTVAELMKNRNQFIGTRVTVRGVPGPVLVHKKTLFLGGPGGMVEVLFGNLQDKKQVERLTSQVIDTPLTVSGLLTATPAQGKEPLRLQIMADAVEF